MVSKLIKNKLFIFTIFLIMLFISFIVIVFISTDEQKVTSSIYDININNIEKNLVTKNTVDIKLDNEEIEEKDIYVSSNKNELENVNINKVTVVNTPIINEKDNIKNHETVETKQEEKDVIKFNKNETAINKMKSIILMILFSLGHLGDVGIDVDKEIFDESKEYLSIDDINESMFTNITINKVKIYAVDEYVNNKFVRTRCYVEIK